MLEPLEIPPHVMSLLQRIRSRYGDAANGVLGAKREEKLAAGRAWAQALIMVEPPLINKAWIRVAESMSSPPTPAAFAELCAGLMQEPTPSSFIHVAPEKRVMPVSASHKSADLIIHEYRQIKCSPKDVALQNIKSIRKALGRV